MAGSRQPPPAQQVSSKQPDFQPRVPCTFYHQGRCRKGANCAFLHQDASEGVVLPNRNRNPLSPTRVDSTSKAPCKYFAQGFCRDGVKCRFAHQEATETPPITTGHALPGTSDSRSHVPCRFFISGGCKNGEACPWSHAQDGDIQKTPDEEVS